VFTLFIVPVFYSLIAADYAKQKVGRESDAESPLLPQPAASPA
jgi:hypothetical protein